jgi:hypothetical protein
MNKKSFWTAERVERLVMWYNRFKNNQHPYDHVAKKLKTSKSAIYQKLGRMKAIDAPWAR